MNDSARLKAWGCARGTSKLLLRGGRWRRILAIFAVTAACWLVALPARAGTLVNFDTTMGQIQVDLFDDVTPQTVANFLNYVNNNRYQNTIVHRAADLGPPNFPTGTPFVVQGGGYPTSQFTQSPLPSSPQHIPTFASPLNEFKLSNFRGTIAMAKLGNNPNSATSEWFFNNRDNTGTPAFLDTQNGGFTVFGWVVSGMSVVDAITALPTTNVNFPLGSITDVPVNGGNFVNLNNVTVVNTHPSFQNPIAGLTLDVNNDGSITPLDMLVIINDLIANQSHAVNPSLLGSSFAYLDTTGNGQVSPQDLLRVINHFLPGAPPAPQLLATPTVGVPEPASWILSAGALLAFAFAAWRVRSRRRAAV